MTHRRNIDDGETPVPENGAAIAIEAAIVGAAVRLRGCHPLDRGYVIRGCRTHEPYHAGNAAHTIEDPLPVNSRRGCKP